VRIGLAELHIPVLAILFPDALQPVSQILLGRQGEPAILQISAEVMEQLSTKQGRQSLGWDEVVASTGTPLPRRVHAPCTDQAMHVRVLVESPTPGVQGHEQARRGTQMSPVSAQRQQALTRAVEQQCSHALAVE